MIASDFLPPPKPQKSSVASFSACLYASVLPLIEAKTLEGRTFSYQIPPELLGQIKVGCTVLVPFGSQGLVLGMVVALANETPQGFTPKPIVELLSPDPLVGPQYLAFLDWVASYYGATLSQTLWAALPSALLKRPTLRFSLTMHGLAAKGNEKSLHQRVSLRLLDYLQSQAQPFSASQLMQALGLSKEELTQALKELRKVGWLQSQTTHHKPKTSQQVTVVCPPETSILEGKPALTARQQSLLEALKTLWVAEPKPALALVEKRLNTTRATLQKIAALGLLSLETIDQIRDPVAYYQALARQEASPLTPEQAQAVTQVLNGKKGQGYLLFGVTGSGKTQVYMALAEAALAQGQRVLMLVPEIALTGPLAQQFVARFGKDNLALWHSQLSTGEKLDTWRRIQQGQCRLVIGARSAIFTPLLLDCTNREGQSLSGGLILMDEAHDGSYKQESPTPRYDARTLATQLARQTGAKVVLGSATPEVTQFYQTQTPDKSADATEKLALLTLPERYSSRPLPAVTLVNMRQPGIAARGELLSKPLKEALLATVQKGEQAIVLLNRRGFNTLLTCGDCAHVFECPQCAVSLTFHQHGENTKGQVRCHHCGYADLPPVFCPKCTGVEIQRLGAGTQRLMPELEALLKQENGHPVPILRLDGDVMKRKNAFAEVLKDFKAGKSPVLVGTQLVAKGLDIPNVTLVGVLQADTPLFMPEYKSLERGFQLLTQVAGRAGRGDSPGQVLLQVQDPNHPVLVLAKAQNYPAFYEYDLPLRREQGFPPFVQLVRFVVSGEDEARVSQWAQGAKQALISHLQQAGLLEKITILGPAACLIAKLHGRYRVHWLVKNKAGKEGHDALVAFYKHMQNAHLPQSLNWLLDVDALSLL